MGLVRIETSWDDAEVGRLVGEAIATGRTKEKRHRMKLVDYNGFDNDKRELTNWKIRVAKELGLIPPPSKCSNCGTTDGEFDYHNEDYSHSLRTTPICNSCHRSLHFRTRSPGWIKRWTGIVGNFGDGTKWFEPQ